MLKKSRKKSSPLLKWGAVTCVSFALFAILGEQGLLKLHQLHQTEERLEEMITDINAENDALATEIALLKDPRYLEKVIRDELGYLRPDEVIYYVRPHVR